MSLRVCVMHNSQLLPHQKCAVLQILSYEQVREFQTSCSSRSRPQDGDDRPVLDHKQNASSAHISASLIGWLFFFFFKITASLLSCPCCCPCTTLCVMRQKWASSCEFGCPQLYIPADWSRSTFRSTCVGSDIL